ncbi:uncharacterized protein LY79DRAFT_564839 [Colletotrichum navitas]|uniref:Uncharacterized protein n=1 Tax=Colletotrichum navitas TaxID=681940 RepID=A0AAD8PR70_9PEZI|nr:uncharacterized protein LY79DRAFT_564839 [Colletotrichum navitas]KAK1579131.1 hypothetical protein LY79DRAFT_564839 [Colletotrichum navitas]
MATSDRDRAHATRRPSCAVCIVGCLGRVSPRHKKTHMRHHWSRAAWGWGSIPIRGAQGSPGSEFPPTGTWDSHCGEGHGESASSSSSHRQREIGVPWLIAHRQSCVTQPARVLQAAQTEKCALSSSAECHRKAHLGSCSPICRPPTRAPSGGGRRHVIYYLVELANASINPAPYVPEGHK